MIGKQLARPLALIAALTLFSGCGAAKLKDGYGYIPDDALLNEVKVGIDTKDTVGRILGPPGTEGIVDELGWYYVQSDYETFLWREPVEVDRQVVAVSFNERGVVQNVERFGLERGRVVALSRRVTTSNTRGIGFLRQLFSNLGTFSAGEFLEEG
ncbi:MAG: outer membrane protein assembly factor BamE [Silicimonas sp.]|jgi:outer membrane protein assembly factor BamE (lipoprotein component of BamABCDE complex)|nr:outer membrane protein assembly factor BamE [Silicimonas sp.]